MLFFLTQGLVGRPDPDSVSIAVMIELLHTATLIHDDVVDHSPQRRGRKSLNALWGDRVSVLVGDYLFAKVLELGVEAGWDDVLRIVSKAVSDMGRGELREELQDDKRSSNVDEYYDRIRDKTSGFFSASCELGGLVVGAGEAEKARLREFGEMYGMAFQIRDDILDFSGYTDRMGKPVGQDVSNGRMTLPLILALSDATGEEKKKVLDGLEEASVSKDDGRWIVRFVVERGGVDGAQQTALRFADEAVDILKTFGPSEYRDSLEMLVAYDLVRDR